MNFLYDRLPKDLVYIIEDYAKDRTVYNKVVKELSEHIGFFYAFAYDQWNVFHRYLLKEKRDRRQAKSDLWYANIKKLKRPHGKREPTYRSSSEKYRLRFGDKFVFKKKKRTSNFDEVFSDWLKIIAEKMRSKEFLQCVKSNKIKLLYSINEH